MSDLMVGMLLGAALTSLCAIFAIRRLNILMIFWRSTASLMGSALEFQRAYVEHTMSYQRFIAKTLGDSLGVAEAFGGNDAIAYILGELEAWEAEHPPPPIAPDPMSPSDPKGKS